MAAKKKTASAKKTASKAVRASSDAKAEGAVSLPSLVERSVLPRSFELPPLAEATKLGGAALARLLDGPALDVGLLRDDEAVARTLPAKERRAYRAAFDAAYSARNERLAWLRNIAFLAARTDEGAARLQLVIASDVDWAVRQTLATALLEERPDDHASLDALASLLSIEGPKGDLLQVRALGARAVLRRDRSRAYDELAPLLATERVSAVLLGIHHEAKRLDDRWLDALLPILGCGRLDLEFAVLAILPKLPVDPRMLPAVLRQAGPAEKLSYASDQLLDALAHCGDARATPLLLRALALPQRPDLVLEALRRSGDPAAAPAVRAFLAKQPVPSALADLAEAAARDLERRGPAPVPAVAPTPVAEPRQRRRLSPSAPHGMPDPIPIAQQRAELVEAFGESGLADVADALIQSSIRLFPTRSEDAQIPVGATKLGGCPDLPPGVAWPAEGEAIYSFVAQLSLEELAPLDPEKLLPGEGLLSFFVQDEFVGPEEDYGKARVLWSLGPLERREVPPGFDLRPPEHALREPFAACTIRAMQLLKVPSPSNELVTRHVPSTHRGDYEEKVFVAFSPEQQVLGWRDAYEDELGEDRVLLLQSPSDDEAGTEWGDVQQLYFTIPKAALAARDFSAVTAEVGD